MTEMLPLSAFSDAELAEKRRYVESRIARDHWGFLELAHVDEMAKWLATVDAKSAEIEELLAPYGTDELIALAIARSRVGRVREVLRFYDTEGACGHVWLALEEIKKALDGGVTDA